MVVKPCALEGMVLSAFWSGKRVLVTGHTGFKGSWLSVWLHEIGAKVAGFALPPGPGESLFELASVGEHLEESIYADICNLTLLNELMDRFRPEIVLHLAAQALVRESYLRPIETYRVNVLGTANMLEAIRINSSCRAVVVVTSDKCYENSEWVWGYRESDPLGGYDPYSSSKGCAELVTGAYRRSFFETLESRAMGVASARAGNVIGGGDFAKDRLVPDLIATALTGKSMRVRNPEAIRPWQHVLEPLSGYLLLAERLWGDPKRYSQSWNFGPPPESARSVRWILDRLTESLGGTISWEIDGQPTPHEAHLLTLDSSKARAQLGWQPRWTLERALNATVEWYKAYGRHEHIGDVVRQQIASYESRPNHGSSVLACVTEAELT
jgi:CDP-glucose 4,6-dehydratase